MEKRPKIPREYIFAVALVVVWAFIYLPNLRISPNWYGDEGQVMDMSWTTAHGHPRFGPLYYNFMVPIPYQPLTLLINGILLRVFGCDIFVVRLFQVIVALATAGICFWIGARLRDKRFGFLCALAFLTYPEVVIHYRWVRPHPIAGTFVLAACGFLISYIQQRRLRDIVLAGVMTALGLACHWFMYMMVVLVVVTVLRINRRHVVAALLPIAAYGILFCVWFLWTQPGGIEHFISQLRQIQQAGFGDAVPGALAEAARLYRQFIEFSFIAPTVGRDGSHGVDIWLPIATLGILFFPVRQFRGWLIFWLGGLMYGVLKSRNNVHLFFYPAMVFVPLMAIGFAGAIALMEERLVRHLPKLERWARYVPSLALIGIFGGICLYNSFTHWRTKIDLWTLRSHKDAEAAMQFVNAHTTKEDFVVMPDQVYWLYPYPYRAQLFECAHYAGRESRPFSETLPRKMFWFDCSWQRAKYLVLAYGIDVNGRPYGIDAIYWMGFKGVREIVEQVQQEKWPVVFRQGEYMVLANPRFMTKEEQK